MNKLVLSYFIRITSTITVASILHGCFDFQDDKLAEQSKLKSTSGEVCSNFMPLPIGGKVDIQVGNDLVKVEYLSHGATGAVYLTEDRKFIYKLPFVNRGTTELTEKQEDILLFSKGLYQDEKSLFLDLPKDTESLRSISSYLAPTTEVTIRYEGQEFEGLRKDFIEGVTVKEAARDGLASQLTVETKRLYDDLKTALFSGHQVYDLHDNNLIYNPNSIRPITIIDGAYGGINTKALTDPDLKAVTSFNFRMFCRSQEWCEPHMSADPDF